MVDVLWSNCRFPELDPPYPFADIAATVRGSTDDVYKGSMQRYVYRALTDSDPNCAGLIDLIRGRMCRHYADYARDIRVLNFREILNRAATLGKHPLFVIIKTCLGAWRTSTRMGRPDETCVFSCNDCDGARDSMRHYFPDCNMLWPAISRVFPHFRRM